MNGVLILDKPSGWTSHDVVARTRHILKERSIGHLGTLDPLATGVLPLVIGEATRLAEYAHFNKQYEAVALLGRATDTEDISGAVLAEQPTQHLDERTAREAVMDLLRITEQVPPMVSAVKQDGVRLYKLARKGRVIERKPRPIALLKLEIMKIDIPRVQFRVTCSPGTYIRSLCRVLGETLGCGACMESLVRTASGEFTLKQAMSLAELEKRMGTGDTGSFLLPSARLVQDFPETILEDEDLKRICAGQFLTVQYPGEGMMRVMNKEGRICAIASLESGLLKPKKVFGLEGI